MNDQEQEQEHVFAIKPTGMCAHKHNNLCLLSNIKTLELLNINTFRGQISGVVSIKNISPGFVIGSVNAHVHEEKKQTHSHTCI